MSCISQYIQLVPEPVIVALSTQVAHCGKEAPAITYLSQPTYLRQSRVNEFLMARFFSVNSKKAYQQDLQRFMDWTQAAWGAVTPRQSDSTLAALRNYNLSCQDLGSRLA